MFLLCFVFFGVVGSDIHTVCVCVCDADCVHLLRQTPKTVLGASLRSGRTEVATTCDVAGADAATTGVAWAHRSVCANPPGKQRFTMMALPAR